MAALDANNPAAPGVATFQIVLTELLYQARNAKQSTEIEPALTKSDFNSISEDVAAAAKQLAGTEASNGTGTSEQAKGRLFAIIETAARGIFVDLVVREENPACS